MTKAQYATPEERRAARSAKAKLQMQQQWEQKRQEEGASLGYFGCHRRVRKERGRAGDQQCELCPTQARHWSHIHDTDPTDVQNYRALCQSCHYRYDEVRQRGAETLGSEGRRQAALKAWETKRRKNAGVADPLLRDGQR